jgi:heme O synthase-like polyprenyltransferase
MRIVPTPRPKPTSSLKLSEAAVFRWVVIVGLAAASVIALTLLTRPLAGALWGLLLVCAAGVYAYRWLKRR